MLVQETVKGMRIMKKMRYSLNVNLIFCKVWKIIVRHRALWWRWCFRLGQGVGTLSNQAWKEMGQTSILMAQNSLSHLSWSKNGLKHWYVAYLILLFSLVSIFFWYDGIATLNQLPNTLSFDPTKCGPSLLPSAVTASGPKQFGSDLAVFASMFSDICGLVQGPHAAAPTTPSSSNTPQNSSASNQSPDCPSPSHLAHFLCHCEDDLGIPDFSIWFASTTENSMVLTSFTKLIIRHLKILVFSWKHHLSKGCHYTLVWWPICEETEDWK